MKPLTSIFVRALVGLTLTAATAPLELTPDGLPPLRLGMTLKQVEQALGKKLDVQYGDGGACGEADAPYKGVGIMLEHGKLVRIDVYRGGTIRMRGVGVGSTQKQVRAAFLNARTKPHFYTDGHYLTARLTTDVSIVFET